MPSGDAWNQIAVSDLTTSANVVIPKSNWSSESSAGSFVVIVNTDCWVLPKISVALGWDPRIYNSSQLISDVQPSLGITGSVFPTLFTNVILTYLVML